MPHLLAEALEAAERVEHAVAPQELVGGCRQLVAVGAELQLLLAAMIVQIFRDDAILEHAAESDADAAGRPRKLSRQRVVGRQQHRAAQNQRQAALGEAGERDLLAQKGPRQEAEDAKAEQYAERRAMGRGRERRE